MKSITITTGGYVDSLSPAEKQKFWHQVNGDPKHIGIAEEKGWTIRIAGTHWN